MPLHRTTNLLHWFFFSFLFLESEGLYGPKLLTKMIRLSECLALFWFVLFGDFPWGKFPLGRYFLSDIEDTVGDDRIAPYGELHQTFN